MVKNTGEELNEVVFWDEFPSIATQKRMKWAGLTPEMFELYTTYENSYYCKPNLDYYRAIIKQIK